MTWPCGHDHAEIVAALIGVVVWIWGMLRIDKAIKAERNRILR